MNGIINVYKPTGITSFDVVKKVRYLSKTKKVGHTGTLDPLACGVLPICIGNATKVVDYIMNDKKEYVAELRLGFATDTYDREGTVIFENEIDLDNRVVIDAIKSFEGNILQVPPMYSALKINGQKLYELARQGIEVERKPRPVSIYSIDIISINLPYVLFKVICSKGTYIRSLCYDIGNKLNCGGTMWNLERVATGIFSKQTSIPLDELTFENIEKYIISVDDALTSYNKVTFSNKYEKLLLNGVTLSKSQINEELQVDTIYKVYINDKFIGLGNLTLSGFKMFKLLL